MVHFAIQSTLANTGCKAWVAQGTTTKSGETATVARSDSYAVSYCMIAA
jgi:hypothetical protein